MVPHAGVESRGSRFRKGKFKNGLNPSALLDSQKSTKCCRIKNNEQYTGGIDSHLIYPPNYAIKDNSSCVTAFHVRDKGDIS